MVTKTDATLEQASESGRRCRSLVLGWTDPESGEALRIDVRGPEGFLHGIEEHGFVVLGDGEPRAPEGWGRRATVVAVARADAMGGPRHGAPRRA